MWLHLGSWVSLASCEKLGSVATSRVLGSLASCEKLGSVATSRVWVHWHPVRYWVCDYSISRVWVSLASCQILGGVAGYSIGSGLH